MSAQAIEAQIDQISLEIERQKDMLRKLESRKSLLQRQLNAERDPIAHYPLEYARPQTHLGPLLLLNICNTWTNIALSTPALWASIGIGFPRAPGFEELLEMWLRRAGSRRLQISIKGACDSLVASSILQHSAQLQSLCISFDETNAEDDDDDGCYELLGGILPEMELPSLQELEIFGQIGMATNLLWPPVHRLLRLSPNLTELNIQNITFMMYMDEEEPETFVLPHLETLYVSTWALFDDSIISFLRQSSPPLLKLKLYGRSDVGNLYEVMSLIPTLTHFESVFLRSPFVAELFRYLSQNPHITPNLQTFQLEVAHNDSPTDILTLLAGLLAARRSSLKTVRLTTSGSIKTLPDDLAATLGQFLADGMDIHVGSARDELNILSQ
ncbi:hypothetical protein FB45DRAFT_1075765 [Roridomyces roridus]|uniref:F-box domain-containing protein n=1 Tax=Roridomyces roridus TaxID=1738132 RepID=A0AAD7CIE8_9AGAR|nr:hypothetical protein FB45DRAFT_1075765 [Roridomyces roridus]